MTAFSKIGLHILRGGIKPEALATAPVLCLVDCDAAYINAVRAANQHAWIVVRWCYTESQEAALKYPDAAAQKWFVIHRPDVEATKGPRIVYQGMNEIATMHSEAYAQYERRRASFLWGIGAGFGLGAWSVGEPDYPAWKYFAGVLVQMQRARDAVLLHEYWAEPIDLTRRWYTARWRDPRVWRYLEGWNVIVTECGRDKIDNRGWAGWRKALTPEGFLLEVAEYNRMCQVDDEILGVCLFNAGIIGEWKGFNCNDLWPRIAATQGAPEPTPEPAPVETHHDIAVSVRWRMEEAVRLIEQDQPDKARGLLLKAIPDAYQLEAAI